MPRPEVKNCTFSLDGREVEAPAGMMLVDAANAYGDVEIPVFCYEPKLGQPVGACRMCLVEIEGIPKLQTACSTPIRDGMVVHTQTDRVHHAQRAVVEFLLINHPLDCPVCDKGGECPLQDVTYGWGPGTSRFIEPKRHFKKPLELSPLVAIDRERCILCYRCVRYSQEIAEDYQLILLERGADSFVGTFDGHPYVAPFSGNIIELCPVGALTSRAYRFRARPWDIEGAGTVCAGCAAQCNVELTVRDERVLRVLGRDNPEVDDGWLCDKGRFSYQAVHSDERIVTPMVREGVELMPASWEKALDAAASALEEGRLARVARSPAATTTNEEAFLLQSLLRDDLGSNHLSARIGGDLPLDVLRALSAPGLQATVPDLEFAHTVLPASTATRSTRRRSGTCGSARASAATAPSSSWPAHGRPRWTRAPRPTVRFAPGAGEGFLVALDAALSGDEGNLGGAASAAGTSGTAVRAFADALRAAGEEVVIVYGERALRGSAGRALLNIAARLNLAGISGAGLLELPASPNGRGLREAGFAPGHGPGLSTIAAPGRDAQGIAEGLASADLHTIWLHHVDPLRSFPDRAAVGPRAAHGADRDRRRFDADRHDPRARRRRLPRRGLSREGGDAHAPGRAPAAAAARRSAIPAAPVRPARHRRARALAGHRRGGQARSAHDPGDFVTGSRSRRGCSRPCRSTTASRSRRSAAAACAGRSATTSRCRPGSSRSSTCRPAMPAASDGTLRLGTYRPLWAAKEVDLSPILHFIRARQVAELSPSDAAALGINDGDRVEVGNGTRVPALAKIRDAVPAGSVFLAEGIAENNPNVLTHALVEVHRMGPGPTDASALPIQVQPAVEGLSEMPPSAPLPIPPRETT